MSFGGVKCERIEIIWTSLLSSGVYFSCSIPFTTDVLQGLYNMQHTWSAEHSRYCCYKREIGCKTKASDASDVS